MLCMNGYNKKKVVLLRLPTVLRFYGSTVLPFYGSNVLPFYGSNVLPFYGSTVLPFYGSTVLPFSAGVTYKESLVLRVKQYQSIRNTWAELDLNQRRN